MSWEPKEAKWDWRDALTLDEAAIIAKSDEALRRLEDARARYEAKYGRLRQLIVNRAIQRAKYDARKR